jgi:tRNA(Arg) A34 adenosine deaminase TadA
LKASDEQDGKMVINGGNINIEADDDAVHAEIELTINN